MNDKYMQFFLFILINFLIISSIIFINQFNFPDGLLHQLTFDNKFSYRVPLSIGDYISNFDMYNISIIKNFIIQLFPNIKNECLMYWDNTTQLLDSCKNQYNYNKEFSFGASNHLYHYSNSLIINDIKIAHIIYIFILNTIFYLIILSFNDIYMRYSALIFLIFPSVINNISYVSPNISSVYFQIILFYLFLNRYFFLYLIFTPILFNIDFQNITNFFIICFSLFLLTVNIVCKINLKYYQILIFILITLIFLIYLKNSGMILKIAELISLNMYQTYTYLNIGESNIFKSLIIFGTSLYYIGGSMSHLAHLLEYLFFVILIIFFIFYNIFFNLKFANSIFSNLNILYFVLGSFAFISLSITFSNFNQGRYGLFLIFPVLYFYFSFFKNFKYFFNYSFLTLFILNNYKVVNFVNSGL
tara:strand:+ start:424 stop:1671 length:1248 start_codon:yes stop_codon:yes gene_type:complete